MKELLKPFKNSCISKIFEVVVYVGEEEYVLCDTIVLVIDNKLVQISIDAEFYKHVFNIDSINDVVIYGDYDDRTFAEFRKIEYINLPIKICGYSEVIHTVNDIDHLIGAFIIGETEDIELSLIMHLDDIEIGKAELLLDYIKALIAYETKIIIKKC